MSTSDEWPCLFLAFVVTGSGQNSPEMIGGTRAPQEFPTGTLIGILGGIGSLQSCFCLLTARMPGIAHFLGHTYLCYSPLSYCQEQGYKTQQHKLCKNKRKRKKNNQQLKKDKFQLVKLLIYDEEYWNTLFDRKPISIISNWIKKKVPISVIIYS